MNIDMYRKLVREYDLKRQRKIDDANKKTEEIYSKIPKLRELEDEKENIAIATTKLMLNADDLTKQVEIEKLEFKMKEIDLKYEKLLEKEGYNKKDLEPNFDCKICNDTGVISENGVLKNCKCFTQSMINQAYRQSNINKLEEENFSTFDIGYYSSKADKEKYGSDKSPLENIECIKRIAEKFCKNIANKEQKNLLFVGNTGLGKTFLANSIANEVINSGQTVVYQTAPNLMDMIMEYKFSYNKDEISKSQYNKIFQVDLLIIDDLGTETMTNNKFTELFNVINTRLLNNKKILISTNLTLNELYKEYDERVMSRIIGNFVICKFIGEDIRLKKKKITK